MRIARVLVDKQSGIDFRATNISREMDWWRERKRKKNGMRAPSFLSQYFSSISRVVSIRRNEEKIIISSKWASDF